MILRGIGCFLCICVMMGSVAAVFLAMYVVQVTEDPEGKLDLDNQKLKQTSIVYDRDGNEENYFAGENNRIWRELSAMPEDLQNAVIAIEDKDFMNEPGINIKRTIAAALNEFTGGALLGSRQGASTLEQQLIKNLTGDDEQDIMRKVREIFRAIGLCNRYSKETILEAYLNTIPLTGTIYGMEAGANEYFGKHVEDLTLSECAILASITKNPKRYNPATNPEMLTVRRNHVLAEMRNQGYITEEECAAAQAEPITLAESKTMTERVTRTSNNSYFDDALFEDVVQAIMEKEGCTQSEAQEIIFSDGLRIYSTLDQTAQNAMEEIMLNEDTGDGELFPALWHEEAVDSSIPVGSEITYDEENRPLNPDGSSVFSSDDVPVYSDEETGTYKTGKTDDGQYIQFYESVRTQAAMCSISMEDGHRGEVVAIVGGLGEKTVDRGTNRATIPHQTGSTMKPIAAYCLALDSHIINYSRPIADAPYYLKSDHKVLNTDYCLKLGLSTDASNAANQARDDVWRDWPTNYGGAGGNGENMLVYDALRRSYNTVAVWIGSYVGAEEMFTFAHDTLNCTHLDPETDVDLAPMVLGSQSQGLTLVELAGAYQIFNDGKFTTPHFWTEIYDSDGNLYLDNSQRVTTVQAIDPSTATIMNRLLSNLWVSPGTAAGMKPDVNGIDTVGKTGTTSDFKDYTFCGLSPYYCTAVWWGYDKPYSMYNVNGSSLGNSGKPTQRAFKQFMEAAQADKAYKAFYFDDNVKEYQFNTTTGALVSSGGMTGYYTDDNLPDSSYASTTEPTTGTLDPATQAVEDSANQSGDIPWAG
ncbi:MAG: transglycosylase domain-containing protein [Gemmiger sp.]|uniref:transglycosylase domain-containing protein n=1 Tax=Gemmiger sp. TaxID=2049027 RepID=UPI002E7763DA|nr:transglycosylase domain-containing protein [Gemmiger sp.]MEE0800197.1 transglycosylase domain-containing protein [Gemmiger sp.]